MKLPNGYGSVVKLSGKRRNPYLVRKTNGWHYDKEKDKQVQDFIIIGYAPTRADGLQMLADYNKNPFDTKAAKMTFDDVYKEWSKRKYPIVSESNVKGYTAAYKTCSSLYHKIFKDLKLADLQTVIDTCGKNYPTLRKIKVLFNQLYDFAIKNDICNKDYSSFVDVVQYKDRNPNKYDRNKFEKDEIDRTPHCCRHTCISMLAEASVDQTIIKKIVGHSGAMTLTEKVYTHLDVKELVNAINKI